MAPLRLLIVDDHPAVREGLANLLAAEDDLLVVGEAENCKSSLDAAARLRPELVLLDLSLPDGSGIDAAKKIRRLLPESRILMMSVREAGADAGRAKRAGISAWITKHCSPQEILGAIRAVGALTVSTKERKAP